MGTPIESKYHATTEHFKRIREHAKGPSFIHLKSAQAICYRLDLVATLLEDLIERTPRRPGRPKKKNQTTVTPLELTSYQKIPPTKQPPKTSKKRQNKELSPFKKN